MSNQTDCIAMPLALLDRFLPMHALVSPTGHVQHAGPTLRKIVGQDQLVGRRFLEAFEMRRPRGAAQMADLLNAGSLRVNLRMRARSDIRLKGLGLALPEKAGLLVSLAFSSPISEVAATFGLSSGDFAPTDLAVELLYLNEANKGVIRESRDLNLRLLGAKSKAEEAAHTDTLTGLRNRRGMEIVLDRYKSCRERFSLMHVDLDYFKAVNDTYGHAAGDAVLVAAAQVLLDELRAEDTVIRSGGDEFVVLLHRRTAPQDLATISNRILQRLAVPVIFEGHECKISGSIGITMSDDYAEIDPDQMMLDADVALYAAKKSGRAQFRFVREVGGVGQSASALANAAPLERAS